MFFCEAYQTIEIAQLRCYILRIDEDPQEVYVPQFLRNSG